MTMIKLSDTASVAPLKIIFRNCLSCGLFPQIWKHANVVPVHKKNERNLKGNYRPISFLPIFGKIFQNSFTIPYILILCHLSYLIQINQVFVQVTLQYLYLYFYFFKHGSPVSPRGLLFRRPWQTIKKKDEK